MGARGILLSSPYIYRFKIHFPVRCVLQDDVMKATDWFIGISLFLVGCGGSSNGSPGADSGGDWYRPGLMTTWQWQLQGVVNTSYDVEIYDLDLFDTSTQVIANLHASGKRVVCYFSAGSYENWRADAALFSASDLGNDLDGWAGERWLDIRSSNVLDIMMARLDTAASKGCDGVEPDNMDGYQNNSGFALTANDQLIYNRLIAEAAHDRRLSVALKNDLDQIPDLVDYFDFAVNEECFAYSECDTLAPFTDAGKPVLHAEYSNTYKTNTAARNAMCAQSQAMQFSSLVLPLDLDDSYRDSCL